MKNVAAMSGGGGQHAHPEPGLGLPVQLPRRASAYDVYATPGAGGLNAMAIAAAQQRASISAQGKSRCINTLSSAHVNVHLSYIVGSAWDAYKSDFVYTFSFVSFFRFYFFFFFQFLKLNKASFVSFWTANTITLFFGTDAHKVLAHLLPVSY